MIPVTDAKSRLAIWYPEEGTESKERVQELFSSAGRLQLAGQVVKTLEL
jgi:hypothetical protein